MTAIHGTRNGRLRIDELRAYRCFLSMTSSQHLKCGGRKCGPRAELSRALSTTNSCATRHALHSQPTISRKSETRRALFSGVSTEQPRSRRSRGTWIPLTPPFGCTLKEFSTCGSNSLRILESCSWKFSTARCNFFLFALSSLSTIMLPDSCVCAWRVDRWR